MPKFQPISDSLLMKGGPWYSHMAAGASCIITNLFVAMYMFQWGHMSIIVFQITDQLSVQHFVLANIKETSKDNITNPLWGESTNDWWIPLTKGQ